MACDLLIHVNYAQVRDGTAFAQDSRFAVEALRLFNISSESAIAIVVIGPKKSQGGGFILFHSTRQPSERFRQIPLEPTSEIEHPSVRILPKSIPFLRSTAVVLRRRFQRLLVALAGLIRTGNLQFGREFLGHPPLCDLSIRSRRIRGD